MMRVAGIATSAAPMTAQLPARPDTAAPAISAARSAPTEIPVATPMPPMIWVPESSVNVRRCTRRTSIVVGEGSVAVTGPSFSGAEYLRHRLRRLLGVVPGRAHDHRLTGQRTEAHQPED